MGYASLVGYSFNGHIDFDKVLSVGVKVRLSLLNVSQMHSNTCAKSHTYPLKIIWMIWQGQIPR